MSKRLGILASIILYGVFKALPLLSGPAIELSSPVNGQTATNHTLIISGIAKNTETLLLNGTILPIDGKGNFSKALTLPTGGAILSLTATDRFGKQRMEERTVFIPK